MKINISIICVIFVFSTSIFSQSEIRLDNGKHYPLKMINPLVHEFSDQVSQKIFFNENGYVVVRGVSDAKNREALINLIDQIKDENIPNSIRLGFMDIYHDDTLAQLRQDRRMYEVFANLLNSHKLWVVFDRVIFQTKEGKDDPLPPHVDQNPIIHPHFSNVQGMLALKNMDESTGTLALIPQSVAFFQDYTQWAKTKDGYIEYQGELPASFVGLRLKEGELVIWDSRSTHSRFRGIPKSDRYAALISFTLAHDKSYLLELRQKYFSNGIGWNNHTAGLRATARPRLERSLRRSFENLTELGLKLYGIKKWDLDICSDGIILCD